MYVCISVHACVCMCGPPHLQFHTGTPLFEHCPPHVLHVSTFQIINSLQISIKPFPSSERHTHTYTNTHTQIAGVVTQEGRACVTPLPPTTFPLSGIKQACTPSVQSPSQHAHPHTPTHTHTFCSGRHISADCSCLN